MLQQIDKKIDDQVPLAKYYQISENIKQGIANGLYGLGGKLPSYIELAKHFDTTRW